MILEDGKFYPMLRLVKGKRDDYCGEAEYAYGKLLLRQKDPVLKLYLDRQQQILSGLRETLSAQAVGRSSQSADRRLEELEQELEILRDALEYYGKGGI
jgi:tRNA (adenine22-N1)-methyltransferase